MERNAAINSASTNLALKVSDLTGMSESSSPGVFAAMPVLISSDMVVTPMTSSQIFKFTPIDYSGLVKVVAVGNPSDIKRYPPERLLAPKTERLLAPKSDPRENIDNMSQKNVSVTRELDASTGKKVELESRIIQLASETSSSSPTCDICYKHYSCLTNLYRHYKRVHEVFVRKGFEPSLTDKSVAVNVDLPSGYEYRHMNTVPGRTEFFVNLYTEADVKKWIRQLSYCTKSNWRVRHTSPNMKRSIYNKLFICQYLMKNNENQKEKPKPRFKRTGCTARMRIVIRTCKPNCSDLEARHPCRITMRNFHNHDLNSELSLRHRDVSDESKEALFQLYLLGHSPSSARSTMLTDSMIANGSGYIRYAADRSEIPDTKFCYNYYSKVLKDEPDILKSPAKGTHELLNIKLEEWKPSTGGMYKTGYCEGKIIVCIVTPLMQRIHETIKQSAELITVSGIKHCRSMSHCIYMLYTRSIVGELPLGFIISESASKSAIFKAITLFGDIIHCKSFFGKGVLGPAAVITDNYTPLKNGWRNLWKDTEIFLASPHVLRLMWKWLGDKNNGINSLHVRDLFHLFRKVLSAKTIDDVFHNYNVLMAAPEVEANPTFLDYFHSVWWETKEEWCVAYRQSFLLKESDGLSQIEIIMQAVKDVWLRRMKAFNVFLSVDFILERFDRYYSRMMLDFAQETVDLSLLKYFVPEVRQTKCERVEKLHDDCYTVVNNKENCVVFPGLRVCTCSYGLIGQFCKHQYAVMTEQMKDQNITRSPVAVSEEVRSLLFSLATGRTLLWSENILPSNDVLTEHSYCGGLLVPNPENNMSVSENVADNYDCDSVNSDMSGNGRLLMEELNYNRFCSILDDLKERVKVSWSPEMCESVNEFVKNYNNLTTSHDSLVSALRNWGKLSS